MVWDWTIKVTDIAIVIATAVGPVLAVQAQKWVEGSKAVRDRRIAIFRVLMATRATKLSSAHVEALNAVPVEFYGEGQDLKAIQDNWHIYLDALNNQSLTGELLYKTRDDAFINLLFEMSKQVNYKFNRSELQKDVYYPIGHAEIETDQAAIRRGIAQLVKGELAIPMKVTDFPADPTAIRRQEDLQKFLIEWLQGERSVKVDQK